ncbi:MAG: DNA replication/repair protein RecF [Breznakia sp.]
MILKKLKLVNFRNYKNIILSFDYGIHFIVGNNGQGKTNLLESIYYLSCTKSHRLKQDKDLIYIGDEFFNVEGIIEKNKKEINIKCYVKEFGKNLFLYRNPVMKVSDFIGFFNAVMFCPDDMNMFNSSPKNRRKFIDLELGKLSKKYTKTLHSYYKLLKERNGYLKQAKIEEIYLDTLEDQMIDLQIIIMKQRYKFLNDILLKSKYFYEQLTNDKSMIRYEYISDVLCVDKEIDIKILLKEKYKKNRKKDIVFKQTTIGIHKDDFIFYINDKEVYKYASQGQKRSLLLSLKLGIVYIIYDILKEYPVLILDDVFSELDDYRRKRLLSLLPENIQIFISSTDVIKIESNKKIKYWVVDQGMCKMMRRN